jgi:hypothetical protein
VIGFRYALGPICGVCGEEISLAENTLIAWMDARTTGYRHTTCHVVEPSPIHVRPDIYDHERSNDFRVKGEA